MRAEHERFIFIPAVVQCSLPPATMPAPKRQALPACRPFSQPALELFERPLMHFPEPFRRSRRDPAVLFLVLQRPFQVEVALISRVFRAPDRSLSTDCSTFPARFKPGLNHGEIASCVRHRHLFYASTHRSVMSVSSVKRRETSCAKRGASSCTCEHVLVESVFSLWNRRPSWGL